MAFVVGSIGKDAQFETENLIRRTSREKDGILGGISIGNVLMVGFFRYDLQFLRFFWSFSASSIRLAYTASISSEGMVGLESSS